MRCRSIHQTLDYIPGAHAMGFGLWGLGYGVWGVDLVLRL